MLERLNYNNFKNLAEDTARFTYNTMQQCGYGLIAGSIVAVLSPSPSNLPSWAIDTLSKTNDTALIYLSNHLDATYVITPAIAATVVKYVVPILPSTEPSELPLDMSRHVKDTARVIAALVPCILIGIGCHHHGYYLDFWDLAIKGVIAPQFINHAAKQLLDAAFPLPKEKPEAAEAATI